MTMIDGDCELISDARSESVESEEYVCKYTRLQIYEVWMGLIIRPGSTWTNMHTGIAEAVVK